MVSEEGVKLIVGLLAVWFALDWFVRSRHRVEPRPRSLPRAGFWGSVAGFTSFVGHAGGPPFQIYVLPLKLPPPVYAGTSVLFFAATNAVKLLPYFLLGQFSTENLETSAVLMPARAAGDPRRRLARAPHRPGLLLLDHLRAARADRPEA